MYGVFSTYKKFVWGYHKLVKVCIGLCSPNLWSFRIYLKLVLCAKGMLVFEKTKYRLLHTLDNYQIVSIRYNTFVCIKTPFITIFKILIFLFSFSTHKYENIWMKHIIKRFLSNQQKKMINFNIIPFNFSCIFFIQHCWVLVVGSVCTLQILKF
jgi:hypothetical protein